MDSNPTSNPDPQRYGSESSRGNEQTPATVPIGVEMAENDGFGSRMTELRNAVDLLGERIVELSAQLGQDPPNVLRGGAPTIILEPETRTAQIRELQRHMVELDATVRHVLVDEDQRANAELVLPEAPPGSPEGGEAEEFDENPWFLNDHLTTGFRFSSPPPPNLLLGQTYTTTPTPRTNFNHPRPRHTHEAESSDEYDGMPQLLVVSGSDSSEDEQSEREGPRVPHDTFLMFRGPSTNDEFHMPGLMSVSESSDEGVPARSSASHRSSRSSSSSGWDDAGERNGRGETWDTRQGRISTMGARVTDLALVNQLVASGGALDFMATTQVPPTVIPNPQGDLNAMDASWRLKRVKQLLGSLEVLDVPLLERFCNVGGGGGEHNDECMICWESLRTEPEGEHAWTSATNAPQERNNEPPNPLGALTSNRETEASGCAALTDIVGVAALPCLHVFHSQCLVPWFDRLATTCPVCRFDLDPYKCLAPPPPSYSHLRSLVGLPPLDLDSLAEGVSPGSAETQERLSMLLAGLTSMQSSLRRSELQVQTLAATVQQGDDINTGWGESDTSEDETSSGQSDGESMPPLSDPVAPLTLGTLRSNHSLPHHQLATSESSSTGSSSMPDLASAGEVDIHVEQRTDRFRESVTRSMSTELSSEGSDGESMPAHSDPLAPLTLETLIPNYSLQHSPRISNTSSTSSSPIIPNLTLGGDADSRNHLTRDEQQPVPVQEDNVTGSAQGWPYRRHPGLEAIFNNLRSNTASPRRTQLPALSDEWQTTVWGHEALNVDTGVAETSSASITGAPDQPIGSADSTAETQSLMSEIQSRIRDAQMWFTRADFPPPPRRDLTLLSQRRIRSGLARPEWSLPKGPIEGGVARWVDKREEERRIGELAHQT